MRSACLCSQEIFICKYSARALSALYFAAYIRRTYTAYMRFTSYIRLTYDAHMTHMRLTYDAHTAQYGVHTAHLRRTCGAHTAHIRRTYGLHTAYIRLIYDAHTATFGHIRAPRGAAEENGGKRGYEDNAPAQRKKTFLSSSNLGMTPALVHRELLLHRPARPRVLPLLVCSVTLGRRPIASLE